MSKSLKKFLPRSLFGRSLMIVATPIFLIQIITTFVFFESHWGKMTGRLAFSVAGEIAVIARQIERQPEPDVIREVSNWASQNLELLVSFEPEALLPQTDGVEFENFRGHEIVETLSDAMEAQVRRPYLIAFGRREKIVEVSVQLEPGILRISIPQRRLFSSSVYVFLRWMIATSIVLLAVAIIFMRNQIRPIRRLAVAAERFGKGLDVPATFKPEGAREVRQAAAAFLEMHERIRRQIQQRTAMLSGVSHDLRTPLTRMKLQVSMLGDSADVEALKSDIADMERMINAYLDFARGEGGEQAARTDLRGILERIVGGIRRQGGKIELETEGELVMQLRPVAFERCLNNLIVNARKYGGDIWIAAKRGKERVEIFIDDNGPGIPEDKFEDVFRPFYRLDESRNPATGGVGLGLGLPIAQDVINGHGGEITLMKSPRGGLRVAITIPV